MNILTIVSYYGEINTGIVNQFELNGLAGKMQLTMDSIDEGDAFAPLVLANLQKLKPRICIPAENRDVDVRC